MSQPEFFLSTPSTFSCSDSSWCWGLCGRSTRSSHAGAGIGLLHPTPTSPSSPSGESFVTQTNNSYLIRKID